MKRVVVFTGNLFLRPALERALGATGWTCTWGARAADLGHEASSAGAVLVDIGSDRVDWRAIVAAARHAPGGPLPVVGFGPHVERGAFREAAEAGCLRVVPNGRITVQAGQILDGVVRDV